MISFGLPICPPLSECFVNHRTRGRVNSGRYMSWRRAAGTELNIQRAAGKRRGWKLPLKKHVAVLVRLPYIANGDLDNRFKATLDLLKTHGVILDDKMSVVTTISATWSETIDRDRMEVHLTDDRMGIGVAADMSRLSGQAKGRAGA